ncbi:hypothetical protein C8R43DRAFT_965504 [Mycena crocata]|nr:hypothetical protein C8R43DRAFT_965504 [Mycena crocata]
MPSANVRTDNDLVVCAGGWAVPADWASEHRMLGVGKTGSGANRMQAWPNPYTKATEGKWVGGREKHAYESEEGYEEPFKDEMVRAEAKTDIDIFTGVVNTLEVLAEAFKAPFLDPMAKTAQSLLTIVQNVKQNKSDCANLMEQTSNLLYDWARPTSKHTAPDWEHHIEDPKQQVLKYGIHYQIKATNSPTYEASLKQSSRVYGGLSEVMGCPLSFELTPLLMLSAIPAPMALSSPLQTCQMIGADRRRYLSSRVAGTTSSDIITLHKIHSYVEVQRDKSKIWHFFRQGDLSALLKACNTGLQEALDVFKLENLNIVGNLVDMQKYADNTHQEVINFIEALSESTTSDRGSVRHVNLYAAI